MSENMESLAGVTGVSMAEDVTIADPQHPMPRVAPGLIDTPDLALTVDDGLGGDTKTLVAAIRGRNQGHNAALCHRAAAATIAKIKRLSVRRCHIAARRPQEV
jgi:hypothetical protein